MKNKIKILVWFNIFRARKNFPFEKKIKNKKKYFKTKWKSYR